MSIFTSMLSRFRNRSIETNGPPEAVSLAVDAMLPIEMAYGVEVLNDEHTPMEFVVDILMRYFGMDWNQACETMLKVHKEGTITIGYASRENVERVVNCIASEIQRSGHPLECRLSATRERVVPGSTAREQ